MAVTGARADIAATAAAKEATAAMSDGNVRNMVLYCSIICFRFKYTYDSTI